MMSGNQIFSSNFGNGIDQSPDNCTISQKAIMVQPITIAMNTQHLVFLEPSIVPLQLHPMVGIKFDSGVMTAADNLVSYGSMVCYQDIQRAFKVINKTVIGAGCDFADFQNLKRSIDQKTVEDVCHEDELEMKPKPLYHWLTHVKGVVASIHCGWRW
ncbi:proteasome subunit beta type-4-like [Haematobia irritans]|uniref:proteasome subunit beta type-4-like n=1 Tax=Haematobia irritans TaxID=7368 RepID=UPI003F500B3B